MTPTFNDLPAIYCPDWAPKAVRTEYEALVASQTAIETKRAEVLAALEAARNQDLAVFTPVSYNPVPMLQAELLHRRAITGYFRNVQAASHAYREKCEAEAERAREDVKKKLVGIGFTAPGNVPVRGDFTPEFVQRHPAVRCAVEKCDNASRFDMGASIRENQQEISDLETKLRALLVSAA